MTTIYNSDLTKEIIQGAKIQTSLDTVPNKLASSVVPVMEVNPKLLREINLNKYGTASNSTSAILYTTPTDKDFYITSAQISLIKDATSTSTETYISCEMENGSLGILIDISTFTLTAQTAQNSISFPFPIKIKRGTNITINNTTNVANIRSSATITGYLIDNITA